jgi:serine/threonine protein kinase
VGRALCVYAGGVNQRFGRYELLEELARGGMGAVHRARDLELGREVAIKVITTPLDPEALARFKLEGEAAARVRHPNVLQVHERGVHQGRPYLVMDMARGGSLKDRARQTGPITGPEAARLLIPIAEALAEVHAAQILHRDLKPENVLLNEAGEPLLADFGIAKAVDRETRYTQTGALMGSPAYMAPEQVDGGALGVEVDVYGLGGILYQLLTDRPPFVGGSMVAVLQKVLTQPPPPPSKLVGGLDPRIEAICLRCLAKDPRARYPDMKSVIAALEEASESASRPDPSSRVAALGGVLVLLTLLLGGALALVGRQAPSPTPTAPAFRVSQLGETGRDGRFRLRIQPPEPLASPSEVRVSWEGGKSQSYPFPPGAALELSLRSPHAGRTTWRVALRKPSFSASLDVECPDIPRWYLELPEPPPLLPGLEPGETPGDYLNEVDESLMRWIPPGKAMAAVPGEVGEVEVSTGFYIGKFEITTAQVRAYRRWLTKVKLPKGQQGRPAAHQSFHDATRYCRWAGGRLPTISEWNLAALGEPPRRRYPWGTSPPTRAHGIETGRYNPPRVDDSSDRTPEGVVGLGGGLSEWVGDMTPSRVTGLEPDFAAPSKPVETPYPPDSIEAGRSRELRGASFMREMDSANARYHPPRPAVRRGRPKKSDETDWRREQGIRLVRSPLRPEPKHLSWKVRFKTFPYDPNYVQSKRCPGPEVSLVPWEEPELELRLLRDPWKASRLPESKQNSFVTLARTEVELPPGRWVFSILHADDGVRMKVRAGERVLGEVDAWIHQIAGHHEVAFELMAKTQVQVEVEHCEIFGGEGLWVELSRQ